jgi:heterogeneous nuclear ribonucleoprotein K
MSNEEQSVNFDDAQQNSNSMNLEGNGENFELSNYNDDNGPSNPPKRQRRSDDEEIRLLIPSKVAGGIIGKGGQHIQKLRNDFKAQVNVGDCQGPERVVTIASDLNTCFDVIREMLKHFDKANGECEVRILIHQSLAGCIIGKGGAKIKELKEKLGCKLKVFSNIAPQSSDRVVQIIGKEDQCIIGLVEIIEVIKDTPIKGAVHNYDPHNFDDVYADEYGGYGMGGGSNFRNTEGGGNSGRGFGGNRSRFSDRGGNSGGGRSNRGSNNNNNNDRGGRRSDFVDPWAQNEAQGGGNSSFGNNGNMYGMNFMGNAGNQNGSFGNARGASGGNMDMEEKTSTQVTIPKDLAGAVIGKGGGRIRRIRNDSQAFIQIDEALPGSTDRIITITGTPKQIQSAQYMLQQSIRDGAAK